MTAYLLISKWLTYLFDWVAPYGGTFLLIKLGCPLGGTSLGKRSRGRQAADSIEPRMGFQLFGGGLCRGEENSLRLFAAVQRIRGVQDPGRVPLGGLVGSSKTTGR